MRLSLQAIAPSEPGGPTARALASAKPAFVAAAVFSGIINVLTLSASLFMLQVYDRVLPSGSLSTLASLAVLVLILYGFQATLEQIRARVFARIGRAVDLQLSPLVFAANIRRGLSPAGGGASSNPFRDLEQLRGFFAGGGPSAIFDLPWTPLYVVLLFLLHPLLGLFGVGGIALLTTLALLNERLTTPLQQQSAALTAQAASLAEAARLNAELVAPLGMTSALSQAWMARTKAAGSAVLAGGDVSSRLSAMTRFSRLSLQSLVLAAGAYLVISGRASGGVMIASSILLGRALAPVELAIAHWRGFVAARQGFERLGEALKGVTPAARPAMALPAPRANVSAEDVCIAPPGSRAPLLRGVDFSVQAGDAVGVIGPSGAGKSSLARALVGVWPVTRGAIRLDGSTLDQWSETDAGRFTGYLPQTVQLFAGTIAQNISRFDPAADSDDILDAAAQAGIEGFIRGLPQGFETQVGEGGGLLSAGQRQRIALARALFRDPFLVVLDEPNSALDAEGEAALSEAIVGVRERGGIAFVVSHRPSLLRPANKVLVLGDGMQRGFGARDEVLKRVLAPVAAPPEARAS